MQGCAAPGVTIFVGSADMVSAIESGYPARTRHEGFAMNLIPCLRYADAAAAIDWLEKAFGFERKAVYPGEDGTVAHAELVFGGGMVMLGSDKLDAFDFGSPLRVGTNTATIYVVVDDPDAHCARAKAAGAEIVAELKDQDYGSRDYAARDPEGHVWSFGTYRPKL